MPTITRKRKPRPPQDGYTVAPTLFSGEQLTELASLLNVKASAMCPLCQAGAVIWEWRYASLPTPKEIRDTLAECGQALAKAVEAVRGLNRTDRLAVLKEYGYLDGNDYDELDPEDAFEQASQRNNDARRRYQADLKAAANLAQTLTVAASRIEIKAGQPEKVNVRVEAEKIIEAYEKITGADFVNSQRRGQNGVARQFVIKSLRMLDHKQAEAAGAIKIWCDRHSETEKELPRNDG